MATKETVLVVEIYSGDTQYGGTFDLRAVEDIQLFTRACVKFVMMELRRKDIKPDRMRTYLQ